MYLHNYPSNNPKYPGRVGCHLLEGSTEYLPEAYYFVHAQLLQAMFYGLNTNYEGRTSDRLNHYLFLRYFQLWGKGDMQTLLRGTRGTKVLQRSFAGLFGANNGNVTHTNALVKEGDKWVAARFENLYPELHRLPPAGVEAARAFAREYNRGQR